MSFREDLHRACEGLAVDFDSVENDISRRISWLWDPEENEGDPSWVQVLTSRENKSHLLKISNRDEIAAWFYPVDKAIIKEQKGGQCDGLILVDSDSIRICWLEIKRAQFKMSSYGRFSEKVPPRKGPFRPSFGRREDTLCQ